MAKATECRFEISVIQLVNGLNLNLTLEEAQIIRNILAKIAGEGPKRSICTGIADALSKVGIDFQAQQLDGSIRFFGE